MVTVLKALILLAVLIVTAIIPEWFAAAGVISHRQSGVFNGMSVALAGLWLFPIARLWERIA